MFDVLKAWDYARTIFRSEKLRIAYIKPEIGTGKYHSWCFEDDCKVVRTVCMLSMYHGYASWLSIMAMYYGYVSWIRIMAIVSWLCIIYYKNDSCESKKVNLKKSFLNHVLIPKKDRSRCGGFAGIFIIEKGDFCVELRAFYWGKKNFGPNVIYYVFWESGGPSADDVDLEVDLKSDLNSTCGIYKHI